MELSDVLPRIVRHLGDPGREVDDIANDAASLALVGVPWTSEMSRELWKCAARVASLLDPSPQKQAALSQCVSSKCVLKADIALLAMACGIKEANYLGMREMELAIEMSDEVVGKHCPIPRSAAMYILHMSCRCMTQQTANILFKGKDYADVYSRRAVFLDTRLRRTSRFFF